ncbi:MAG TPA: FAD-dependent oxidoreductase [Polyangiaceae bacterium]|nr:FAD-dependent oxidoreductase [Polyangiaceae bacterium]
MSATRKWFGGSRVAGGPAEFDVVVLGGGAAGLTASGVAASFGAKTLLVERARLGGDCTWTGCIPSKALLKAAKVAHAMRRAARYGLADHAPDVDTRRVMAHVRAVRQGVYEHADAPPIFEAMGVEVRAGRARFVDPHTVAVAAEGGDEMPFRARYVIVATGARPSVPPIEGLDRVPALTSESVFELEEVPRRLLIVGGGPVGCELAQAFCRLGARVTVAQRARHLLPGDDPELTEALRRALEGEGVECLLGAEVRRVANDAGAVRATIAAAGGTTEVVADAILLAVGRRPNVEGLGLEAAGVGYADRGIAVDDRCRTSARHVFACGDVTGRYQFTHMSEHMAKVAVTNAVLGLPSKVDARYVPRCTFTDPELAHVGASEADLVARGVRFDVYRFPYDKLDRAIADGETTGLVKVLATRPGGRILGASVLGAAAGELIGELAVAMRNGVTLRRLADTIHPYPTYGLGVRRAADQWYVRKRSKALVRVLRFVFGYRGLVRDFDPDEIV